ncbi:RHS repeat-associated core domain-containing protein [Catellatospora aurea]|uniref:RHS repeat-associated core domain-containing protein n=1 Tax=Catellatospora aurea TaxID=1337874 RepID=A0ABW2HAQ4_9ACTN
MTLAHVPAQAVGEASAPEITAQRPAARGTGLVPDRAKPDPTADKAMRKPDAVTWPGGGTADIDAAWTSTGLQEVGGLPLDVTRSVARGGPSAADAPQQVRVQVLDRVTTQRLGAEAPAFRLSRADGGKAAQKVSIRVGYSTFAHARGGDWGARLRLVAMPVCALTEPGRPECRTRTPLPTVNDHGRQVLSADIDAVAGDAASMVFTMAAADASAQGDYKATPLSPSSSWSVAPASGGFSWSYPIRLPGTPGGFSPTAGLGYASQAVDGRTTATNNQGSWIGEGFSYEPGYIERRYKPCKDDGHDGSAEQCWAFHNGTVMMAGRSGGLVKVTDDLWRMSEDDGSKIERLTGANNGDDDGEYWKITTTDGTQYFFGKNRLPGWTAAKQETESVWTVPVFGDDANEPCHKTSGFDDSWCNQAWRWNLDYAIDPRGNVISYFYDAEINHYARSGKTDVNGTRYERGGYLTRIDYGQRDQQVYSTDAPARIVFKTTERCLPAGAVDCDPDDLTEATAASWPDVPEDLICKAGTHCEWTQSSPTFFTRKRLTGIETQIRQGAGWSPVESWALEHEFKVNDDNSRTLWLKKITHTGHWGDPDITLPSTELDGIQLPNRIVRTGDNLGPLIRYRLSSVKTGTGAQVTVNYAPTDCSKDSIPAAGTSDRRCFPVIWNPLGGDDEDEVTDWFHKYVVANVVADDLVGGNPDMVTAYEYTGGAGWRKTEPDGITKTDQLTWSDWRGYPQVTVRTGDGQQMPTRVDYTFLRGMSGGKQPDGTSPAVTRTDSTGTSYTDHNEFSGHQLETVVYNGSEIVSKSIEQPWRRVTYTRDSTWGDDEAVMVRTNVIRNLVAMPDDEDGNPTWRETKTVTSYDDTWGRVTKVDDLGEVGAGKHGDDTCARTWYADNDRTYMYTFVSRIQTVAVNCSTTADLSTDLISDSRTSYDFHAWGQGPDKGTPTLTEKLDRYDGSDILYHPTSEIVSVDGYGRPTATKNALGRVSTSQFTEVDGLTVEVKATSPTPFSFQTVTTMDPAFGANTAVVDMNDNRTDLAYDSLGRLTSVWLADRSKAQGASPTMKFGYDIRADRTTVVTTERINNDGSYRPSYQLLDGMFRQRQAQDLGPGGTWLLADTFHIGTGQAAKTYDSYAALGTPGGTPIVTPEGATNGRTTIVFDGAGRPIAGTFAVAGDARWTTTTAYEGDRTHVDPPEGGIPTTVVTDARGHTTELRQYHGDSPTGDADVTSYTYAPDGALVTVTQQGGARWVNHYDQRGQKVWVEDPDAGDTRYTYDDEGKLLSSTDELGNVLSYKYDELGRKTEMWQGPVGGGTKLAAWVFDSLAGNKGQLHYSQRITAGGNYNTVYAMRDKLYRPMKVNYTFPSGDVGSLLGKTYQLTSAFNTDGSAQSIGYPAAGGLPAESIVTTYDNLLRPTALTGATSYVTAATYDDLGQLTRAELHTGGTGKKAWLSYEYERGTHRLTRSRLDRQGVATIDMDARYGFDPAGNVLSIADLSTTAGGTDIQCFAYDHVKRLTEAWSHGDATKQCDGGVAATGVGGPAPYHHSWSFDEAGNREVETQHSVTGGVDTRREYGYPDPGQPQPHTLRTVTETGPAGQKNLAYTYDAAGNTRCRPNVPTGNDCLSGTGSQALSWNAEGQLASTTPPGGLATTYVYDADGTRIARKDPGGNTTIFLPGMELATNGATVTGTRFYNFVGRSVAVRNNAGVSFQAADHHGTASCTVDAATGAITWRRTTPYGKVRGNLPTSWPDRRGFLGATEDPTGLTHLGAREYDATVGRFISVDPLIDPNSPGELGGYAYAGNNPVVNADRTGEKQVAGGGVSYIALTWVGADTIVDQNRIPHVLRTTGDNDAANAGLDFANDQLKKSGQYLDPATGNGSIFVHQDDTSNVIKHPKGVITGADGQTTVTGTTADAVKITYVNGQVVSVDSYDFTQAQDVNRAENDIKNKLRTDTNKGAKKQTQNVIYVAPDDVQAEELRKRFAGNPNVRIINPATGYDTGELNSPTELRARVTTPRLPRFVAKIPATISAFGQLSVVGDLYQMWQVGDALGTKDPVERAIKMNMIACASFSPSCQPMAMADGFIYNWDGSTWVNSGALVGYDENGNIVPSL